MKKKIILIVDDDKISRMICRRALERSASFEIHEAGSGSHALALLHPLNPDLVLLDVVMQDMTGFEVARKMASNASTCQIPIMYLSAQNKELESMQGFTAGDDYIIKPYHEVELMVRIEEKIKQTAEYSQINSYLPTILGFLNHVLIHEMNTPLNVLKGNTRMIQYILASLKDKANIPSPDSTKPIANEMPEQIDKLIRYNELQNQAIKQLEALTGEVSLVVQTNQYEMPIERQAVYIKDLLLQALDSFRSRDMNDIITTDLDHIGDGKILGDEKRLVEVIRIILDNSLRYTFSSPKIVIRVLYLQETNEFLFQFQDNGMGIEKDQIRHVFKPFYTAHALLHHTKGLGLGLYIAKTILAQHAGRIWIESQLDQGTTVYLRIPKE